jgi:hypothetical protein
MADEHVCDEKVVLERAFAAADATQWQGNMTVNFLTMARAARVLAKEVRRLQANEILPKTFQMEAGDAKC